MNISLVEALPPPVLFPHREMDALPRVPAWKGTMVYGLAHTIALSCPLSLFTEVLTTATNESPKD